MQHARAIQPADLRDPRWARALFFSTWAAWLWLVVRLYMASIYLPSGWSKVTSGTWLFGDGTPILGLVGGAVSNPSTPTWYAAASTSFEQITLAVRADAASLSAAMSSTR